MEKQRCTIHFDNPNWQACFEHFLQSLETDNTRYHYRLMLELFFTSTQKQPDAITKGDVESFIHSSLTSARSSGKPMSPSAGTVNLRLSAIASLYTYAATYSVDGSSGPQPLLQRPAPTIGVKHVRRGNKHRTLSDAEIARLF